MSRERSGLTISGFCITNHHELCKHEFDFGAEYLQRYFVCQCECHLQTDPEPADEKPKRAKNNK